MGDQRLVLKEWLKEKLSLFLKLEVPDEMAENIINFNTEDELRKYFKDLLDGKDNRTRKFIAELLQRKSTVNSNLKERKKTDAVEEKYKVHQKNRLLEDKSIGFVDLNPKKCYTSLDKPLTENATNKKKNKYVNFYQNDGETVLLKGRYVCNCESRKHKLINNCLTCGRIVCEQEGSGPCYVCGTLVCTLDEQSVFNGDTSKASKLYEKLLLKEKPKGLEAALKQRDKLLDFDRNSRKHVHVFDDDADYFSSSNPWLKADEREEVKIKEKEYFDMKYESRRTKKINLKIDGGKVMEDDEKVSLPHFTEDDPVKTKDENSQKVIPELIDDIDHLIDPYFSNFHVKFNNKLERQSVNSQDSYDIAYSHIMDVEMHHLKDEGYCLSMHQPFASFLVHGIRFVEGRTWYTSYRGKLWIASGGVRIDRKEVSKYENMYRHINGEEIKFPADYPPGVLLGCVDLVDCLTQEQYRHEFPDGEVEDPYVFVCRNPQLLPIRYPIKGKPKIFKLDNKIHEAATACLRKVEQVLSRSEHKVKSLRP